ncbi:YaiI/YqxD family protein [Vagococcus zengguangii]|uniref:YaiI/YqxD family protein n=1 Tax=Vagococcus zengguangii TaxID=2571750 RepID=UPI001108BE3C|nr:YaiI/YqxD family protein [Vagococcus zengguangii]TLG79507.1 YaiI/YqxD family protein [Vagococcus zengguangii]
MRIIIDGDACPVKQEIYQVALETKTPVILVSSYDHVSDKHPEQVEVVYVDRGADSADYKIIGIIQAHDILVTQDYGLASLALPKKVRVLHHTGKEYTYANIDQLLEQRHHSAKLRRSGQRTKGPSKLTIEQKEIFKALLTKIIAEGVS